MKRISIIGLCFAAVLVVSAMGVSSASALPQFYHCATVNKGALTSGWSSTSTCESLSTTGTAVWWAEISTGESVQIPKGAGSGGKLIAESLPAVTCTATKITKGELTPGNESMLASKVVIEYSGCSATVLGVKVACGPGGVVTTKALMGTLGYTTEANAKHVGMVFEPEVAGETFATFSCSTQKNEVTGFVIGLFPEVEAHGITQIGTAGKPVMRKEFEIKFECEPAGTFKQKDKTITLLTTGTVGNLNLINNGLHEACVEGSGTLETAEPVEIMA